MHGYQPLGKESGMDFRSTFTYTSDGKAPASETQYSSVSIDIVPGTQYVEPSQAWLDYLCTTFVKMTAYLCFILTFPFSAIVCFKMAHQYERIVVYRLGRLLPVKGPGFVFILPCIDRWSRVDLRTKAFNVPPTRVCTRDGGLILIGGVIHFRVQNPLLVKNSLQDMNHSVRVMAQAAMSKILSKKGFSEIMSSSNRYNYDIQFEINTAAGDWGLEIGRVELSQPVVEVAPSQKQSGLMGKLASGFGGGGDAMSQIMGMVAGTQNDSERDGWVRISEENTENTSMEDTEKSVQSLLSIVRTLLSEEMVSKVDAAYEFKLTDNNQFYYINLKTGSGSCGKGHLPSGIVADTTMILSSKALHQLLCGEISPFRAYTSGALEMEGDLKMAMRLEELVKGLKAQI